MPSCANKGCGKQFEPESNDECYYHPGAPVFHDALKGYSCCKKRVTDFDQFLMIVGCTVGKHSFVAQVAPVVPVTAPAADTGNVVDNEPRPEPVVESNVDKPKVETFKMEDLSLKPAEKVKIPETELHDDPEAIISENAYCKRPSCGAKYVDASSRTQECVYHAGVPVFHEGSKGWSCCPKKTFDFDEFLKLKGCQKGLHRFTEPKPQGPVVVDCRRDWYQTQEKVMLSIFAKKVDKSKSKVIILDQRLEVDVTFQDGSIHQFYTDLFQPVMPEQSKFEILSTKIEIALTKANGLSWAALEPTSGLKSFTTFGLQGNTTGTVGAKTAIIAGDVPVELIK